MCTSTTAKTAVGTLTTDCSEGIFVTITLGQGVDPATGAGSTDAAPQRRLKNGDGVYLAYNIFQNSGNTTVWGNTEGTGVSFITTVGPSVTSVYGQIPAGQSVPAAFYNDNVVATITY